MKKSSPVHVTLTGFKEFDAKLRQFEAKAASRISRNTLGAGARLVQKEIKKEATPVLKPTIGMRNERGRKSGRIEAKVGVNVGKRSRTKAKRWAPLMVLGSQPRTRKTIGGRFAYIAKPTAAQLSTGRIKENQIVRRGYSAAQGSLPSVMRKAFNKSLAREVAKAKLNKGKS